MTPPSTSQLVPGKRFASFQSAAGCLLLFFFRSLASADVNLPLNPPPQAVALSVKAPREEQTEITLSCAGAFNQIPKFRIRTQPQFGTLTEPRLATKDTATVVYTPDPYGKSVSDRFSYSVQTSQGVSVPAEITLQIIDQAPSVVATDELDFGEVLIGGHATRTMEIENRGGGVAEGTYSLQGDFKIVGANFYRLARNEKRTFDVTFSPTQLGKTAGSLSCSSQLDRETTLRGEGVGVIQALPEEISLGFDAKDGVRRGRFEIVNRTDLPQHIQLQADPRLKLPGAVDALPGARTPVLVEMPQEFPEAIAGAIKLTVPGFSTIVRARASALSSSIKVAQTAVAFGQLPWNETAVRSVAIGNSGGLKGSVSASIGRPFSVAPPSLEIEPGTTHSIQVELKNAGIGVHKGLLVLKTSSGIFNVPVEAEVSLPKAAAAAPPAASISDSAPVLLDTGRPRVAGDLSGAQYSKLMHKICVTKLDSSSCELSWEGTAGARYQLESARLFFASNDTLQIAWESLDNSELAWQGDTVVAKVAQLASGTPYKIRAVVRNPSGKLVEVTQEANFRTPPGWALFTPMRMVLFCLVGVLLFLAKRKWMD